MFRRPKIWAVIGNFQDMSWHPSVSKSEGQSDNPFEATRRLTLVNGEFDTEDSIQVRCG
jgi:hypothetical protein